MSHLQFLKVDELMALKYGYLMLPGTFPDKVTPDIYFTDEAVVKAIGDQGARGACPPGPPSHQIFDY